MENSISDFENEIIEHIPESFRYMARDSSGELYMYEEYPFKDYLRKVWNHDCGISKGLPLSDTFNFVKWEDEPWQFR